MSTSEIQAEMRKQEKDAQDSAKVQGGVVVKGSGAAEGVALLSGKVGMELYVDDKGHLQVAFPPSEPTKNQQLVMDAISSSEPITLNFETSNFEYNYGRTDSAGGHDIDLTDIGLLKNPENHSEFTPGGVVLHELAEAYAEVNPGAAGKSTSQAFANSYAPGLSKEFRLRVVAADHSAMRVLTGDIIQTVQDGRGTTLTTRVAFWPPLPFKNLTYHLPWPGMGPVLSVRSDP